MWRASLCRFAKALPRCPSHALLSIMFFVTCMYSRVFFVTCMDSRVFRYMHMRVIWCDNGLVIWTTSLERQICNAEAVSSAVTDGPAAESHGGFPRRCKFCILRTRFTTTDVCLCQSCPMVCNGLASLLRCNNPYHKYCVAELCCLHFRPIGAKRMLLDLKVFFNCKTRIS